MYNKVYMYMAEHNIIEISIILFYLKIRGITFYSPSQVKENYIFLAVLLLYYLFLLLQTLFH